MVQVWDDDSHPDGEPDDFIGRLLIPLQPFVGAGPVVVTAHLHDPSRSAFDVNYIEADSSACCPCPQNARP